MQTGRGGILQNRRVHVLRRSPI